MKKIKLKLFYNVKEMTVFAHALEKLAKMHYQQHPEQEIKRKIFHSFKAQSVIQINERYLKHRSKTQNQI